MVEPDASSHLACAAADTGDIDDDDAPAEGEAAQLLGVAVVGGGGEHHQLQQQQTQQLRRDLGTLDGVAIVVGVIVGSGIFASPGVVLSDCGSVALGLLAWLIAGMLAAASALVYCELGAMMPSAGGDFEYLTRAWGGDLAFAWAVAQFTVQKPCSLAIVSLVVGRYTTVALGMERAQNAGGESPAAVLIFAVCYVLAITAVNVLPVGAVAKLQDAMTLTKPALVGGLVVCAVLHAMSTPMTLTSNFQDVWAGSNIAGFGPGVFAALWAFNGWTNVVHMAEEMQQPQRQLPHAIMLGVLVVILIYVTCNLSYLAVLPGFAAAPAVSLAETSVAAVTTVEIAAPKRFAMVASTITSLLIFVSGVGTSLVTCMTGGRYLFAVARAGQAPHQLARLSRWQTPHVALWAQAMWAIGLLLTPGVSIGGLMSYFGVSSWTFYFCSAAGLLKLRRTEPQLVRRYRAPLLSPVLCMAASVLLVGATAAAQPLPTLAAGLFICSSWPLRRSLLCFGVIRSDKRFVLVPALPAGRDDE